MKGKEEEGRKEGDRCFGAKLETAQPSLLTLVSSANYGDNISSRRRLFKERAKAERKADNSSSQ